MKRFLMILALLVFMTGLSYAYTLQEKAKLTHKDFKKMLEDKIVALDMIKMSDENGDLFVMARDNKKRTLEWYLVNPYSKKVLDKGECPFRAFHQVAVSADSKSVVVSTRYPSGIYCLDVTKKEWKKCYQNPEKGQGGLAILSISPLTYIENTGVYSIMDKWDAQNFVVDTFITLISPEPFSIKEIVSLKSLRAISVGNIFKNPPSDWKFAVDFMRFGENRNFIYVLKSRNNAKTKYKDYLFHFSPPKKISLIDQVDGGRLFLLDFVASPMQALYTTTEGGKEKVIYYTDGKKEVLVEGKAIAGRIMRNNLIGIMTVKDKTMSIYLGKVGQKFEKIKTFTGPYSVGFTLDGTKLILTNPDEIRCFSINQ